MWRDIEHSSITSTCIYDANKVRNHHLQELHKLMDKHITKREHKLKKTLEAKDTTTQWDLIAAAAEDAIIEFYGLKGAEAKKMRGRSKITFQKKSTSTLQAVEKQPENADMVTRAKWLRKIAGQHAKLGNKLIVTARRIKAQGYHQQGGHDDGSNKTLIDATIHAYIKVSADQAKKHILTDKQKEQIRKTWQQNTEQNGKVSHGTKEDDDQGSRHVDEVQQAAKEFKDMLVQALQCDPKNTIHAAKMQRLGEQHAEKAKAYNAKVKAEVIKAKRQTNDSAAKGMKNVSRSISGPTAKPLMGVFRDRDTPDGGKKGQMTSEPAEVDAVVKRAWQAIYQGMEGCIDEAVKKYLSIYCKYVVKMPEAELTEMDAQMVFDSFKATKESAGALDGWSPRELSLLSYKICGHIANMLKQIEGGARWPRSANHALIAYLEKEGAEAGHVMSFRPITITAPLYRAWATMRLRSLQPWVREWALPEMHAGVPELGAVDAWMETLATIEDLKLEQRHYCGGTADIAKFFDQVRRPLVYQIAKAAGMPQPVLTAYANYLDSLYVYNCLAGGVGRPYLRRCGIPQGCPFSMAMVALIMRPWILLMRTFEGITCCILADDVLILATGKQMARNFSKALDATHTFLHDMGAKVAPTKSLNFATHRSVKAWLGKKVWAGIGTTVKVVDDLRYLGAHITTTYDCMSGTLEDRISKAITLLQRLRYCPASVETKVRAITTKVYAAGLYGVEATQISTAKVAKLSAAVIDAFRSRNNSHNADRFYTTLTTDKNDLDPMAQVLVRRVLQIRRTSKKRPEAEAKFKRTLKKYAVKHKEAKGEWPCWYYPDEEEAAGKTFVFPPEQPHPSTKEHDQHWSRSIVPVGPIGLLIEAALWHGMAIDDRLNLRQKAEQHIDILEVPYQSLKKLTLQAAAIARNRAEWSRNTGNSMVKEFREIDREASQVDPNLDDLSKG